ncbi:MAG: ABC transporter permease [Candidatus Nanopelagicaceae bacterium]|jgi:peptide/nickel transport system permease protein
MSNPKKERSAPLIIGCILVGFIASMALISLFWTPYSVGDMTGDRLGPLSSDHWLGTDKLGRDLLSRVMIGARIAITVGFASVFIGAILGVIFGLIAGFAQRWVDESFSAMFDILIAFPTLLLAMLVVAARGASLTSAIIAIGFGMSAIVARLTRLLVKRVLAKDFITASRASGTSWMRIILVHILPNIWPTLIVTFALQFGFAGLTEASLSYLGLGAPPPNASWGSLLQEAQATVLISPVAAIAPGLLLVCLVIGMNMVADGLRDVADPTLRRSR